MRKIIPLAALIGIAAVALAAQPVLKAVQAAPPVPSPTELVAAAPASDWIRIDPNDVLVMDLAADAKGKPRRVVIQLMPPPFSVGWIGNIRKLAAAKWWDGTSVNRVQDNYVVQWGDVTEKKALPVGLVTVGEGEYSIDPTWSVARTAIAGTANEKAKAAWRSQAALCGFDPKKIPEKPCPAFEAMVGHSNKSYAEWEFDFQGWPIASDYSRQWPVHCYGMVGVGRGLSPDTGSGAELYTVIGHAPRHLDRNIAVVGRVIEGIEHLSSLPRGTEALGFYKTADERVPILAVRIASDMATDKPFPTYEYLNTESRTFATYADARANRRDPFFITPAGSADICNIPVPVRRAP
jgi:cyclophilin family peptidyl-prolyl cis-trans isomerase